MDVFYDSFPGEGTEMNSNISPTISEHNMIKFV